MGILLALPFPPLELDDDWRDVDGGDLSTCRVEPFNLLGVVLVVGLLEVFLFVEGWVEPLLVLSLSAFSFFRDSSLKFFFLVRLSSGVP